MLLVKSSSGKGVGGSGGLERESATLLDSPVTCLMSQLNWLINRSWRSARKGQVEVEWALLMELVRGLWSVYIITFLPSMKCWNFRTAAKMARSLWLKVEYQVSGSESRWLKKESGSSFPRWC